jgi:hypothetical protein
MRKNAVAGGLHDITVVAVDGINHQLECGIDDRAGFFGVEVLHQLHRALDVREESGDGLTLAVERRCLGVLSNDGYGRSRLSFDCPAAQDKSKTTLAAILLVGFV